MERVGLSWCLLLGRLLHWLRCFVYHTAKGIKVLADVRVTTTMQGVENLFSVSLVLHTLSKIIYTADVGVALTAKSVVDELNILLEITHDDMMLL